MINDYTHTHTNNHTINEEQDEVILSIMYFSYIICSKSSEEKLNLDE